MTAAPKTILHKDLSYKLQGVFFDVRKEYGPGQKESVYGNLVAEQLKALGLAFEREKQLPIFSRTTGKRIGVYRPDIVVENKIVIEIKSSRFPSRGDEKQLYYYLRNSGYEIGYLVNFSTPRLTIRRIIYTNDRKPFLKEAALILSCIFVFVFVWFRVANATEFSSTNFKVLDPILHVFGGLSTSTSYRQLEAGGQAAIGISTSSSFIVKGGFLYFPGPATPAPPPAASPSPAPGSGGALPPLGSPILAPPVVVPPPAPTPTVAPFRPPRKPPPRVLPPEIDLNRDGYVDLIDVSIMLFWWHKPITPQDVAAVLAAGQFPPDPNGDGTANILDLSILLYYWTG